MSRTAVGICAAVAQARWSYWDDIVTFATRAYARAVQRAGALALLLPPDERAVEDPGPLLDCLDALLLAGGSDVDPSFYGAEPHPETKGTWPERDAFEIAMTRGALDREIPVLGTCRGMQVLNVALGGTLEQHLPDRLGHANHRQRPGTYGDHQVRLDRGSLAARAAGGDRVAVKSHHHQGVDRLGEGLNVTGWSLDDDVVEAIELPGREFALGVLWHPEEDERDRVVAALVEAGRSRGRAPAGPATMKA